ncbi:hypothetical protein FISHEDRAFT_24438, partial [Fistulina hepatica ATCC 64428]
YTNIDEDALYTSLYDRVDYLSKFINFSEDDMDCLAELSTLLLPMIPQLVDNVYYHFFKFDVTKKVFLPRAGGGMEGRTMGSLHELTLDAPQIEIRKKTFSMYLRKLVTCDFSQLSAWEYFDNVGLMHTGEPGLKHRKVMGRGGLRVDLMHLSITLAWTLDMLTPIILTNEEWPILHRVSILRALQKVLWIQNDLFARHY